MFHTSSTFIKAFKPIKVSIDFIGIRVGMFLEIATISHSAPVCYICHCGSMSNLPKCLKGQGIKILNTWVLT